MRHRIPSIIGTLAGVFCCGAVDRLPADEKLAVTVHAQPEDVLALLRHRCVKCHGPINPEGELNLSSLRGIRRGGAGGEVVVPRQLEPSRLWQRVSADEMPPESPLSEKDKSLLRDWIASGSPGLPDDDATEIVGADHWAFQPLRKPALPQVVHRNRIRTDADRFVQAKLEARGLSMSPDADRPTLVRRVSLDVTGLPPTPDEIRDYLEDASPDAYERMVDRYLSSAHYGERWGKHWLDAAGYADSNGYFSADTDRPLAYRYRDYVIRSVGADMPFDRFLQEQLAGDELAGIRPGEPTTRETIELLEATHFLRNGQDGTDIGIKDQPALEIDRRAALEAVVQVTASSLLGLTLHCARCHDHKFEPISQRDYYEFQAIVYPAFNPQNWTDPKDRVIRGFLPQEQVDWEENERQIVSQLVQLRSEHLDWLKAHPEPAELLFHEPFDDDSWMTRWSDRAPGDDHPGGEVAIGGERADAVRVEDGQLQVLAGQGEAWLSTTAAIDWTPEATDAWVQATFDLVADRVGGNPAMRIGYTIAAHDFDDSSAVDGGNLLIDGNPSDATSLYRDYPGGDSRILGQIGGTGYVPDRNYGVRVTNIGDEKFRLEHIVDGVPDGASLELKREDLPGGGFAFFLTLHRNFVVDEVRIERSPEQQSAEEMLLAAKRKARRDEYERRRKELEDRRTAGPGRAIAWVSDQAAEPPEVPFLTRGLYHLKESNVDADALEVLTDPGHEFQPVPPSSGMPTTGRRLGFARWLTRDDGRPAALAARVHANRVWQRYFGRGIVETTDNLGLSGAVPSNPELLDSLAADFIAGGWSQKALHRQILTSTVYRQSSAPRAEGTARDPDNRYLWRWPIRRMDAETIRDSMLAVSGQLDPLMFGPYIPTQQAPDGEVVVDDAAPGARRRSVYLQQRRSQTLSMLKVFDAPAIATVCSTRPVSTVPLQSLALLNADFAVARGVALAARIRAEGDGDDAELVRRAWQIAICREPTAEELALSLEFLIARREQEAAPDPASPAVAEYCQMLLASNAFLYLE